MRKCRWCGMSNVQIEKHHLYRRSARPDLIDDPKNLLDLCKWRCHVRATADKKFEEKLQIAFYPNPPEFKTKNTI